MKKKLALTSLYQIHTFIHEIFYHEDTLNAHTKKNVNHMSDTLRFPSNFKKSHVFSSMPRMW